MKYSHTHGECEITNMVKVFLYACPNHAIEQIRPYVGHVKP